MLSTCGRNPNDVLLVKFGVDATTPCKLKLSAIFVPPSTGVYAKEFGMQLKIIYRGAGSTWSTAAQATLTPDKLTFNGTNNTWGPFEIDITQTSYPLRLMISDRKHADDEPLIGDTCADASGGVVGESSYRWDNMDLRIDNLRTCCGTTSKFKCQRLGMTPSFCSGLSAGQYVPFYGNTQWAEWLDQLARSALENNYTNAPSAMSLDGRSEGVSTRCAAAMKALTCARYFPRCDPDFTDAPEEDFCPCRSICDRLKAMSCPLADGLDCDANAVDTSCGGENAGAPEKICFSPSGNCTSYSLPAKELQATRVEALVDEEVFNDRTAQELKQLHERKQQLDERMQAPHTALLPASSSSPPTAASAIDVQTMPLAWTPWMSATPDRPFTTSSVVAAANAAAAAFVRDAQGSVGSVEQRSARGVERHSGSTSAQVSEAVRLRAPAAATRPQKPQAPPTDLWRHSVKLLQPFYDGGAAKAVELTAQSPMSCPASSPPVGVLFNHVSKTGGTTVKAGLKRVLEVEGPPVVHPRGELYTNRSGGAARLIVQEDKNHSLKVTAADARAYFVIGTARPSCDFALSRWAYMSDMVNLQNKTIDGKVAQVLGRSPPYADTEDRERFASYVREYQLPLSTLMSGRYESIDHVHCWVRTHVLETDLQACLSQYNACGGSVDLARAKEVISTLSVNDSPDDRQAGFLPNMANSASDAGLACSDFFRWAPNATEYVLQAANGSEALLMDHLKLGTCCSR